jgi:large conductance mechanosensitive channel
MAEKKITERQAAARVRTAKARERALVARNKVKEKGTTHASGFTRFIREQGVIGLAVGLAIGTAAGDTVKKLVEGFISPVVQFLIGSRAGLEAATWHMTFLGRHADFKYGAFVSSAIALLATALVVYWFIHVLKLDRIDKKKDA